MLGEIAGGALGVIVLASVISAVFTQSVSGSQPAFWVPAYAFHSAGELPLYVGLGILAGLVAAWYVGALYFAKDLLRPLAHAGLAQDDGRRAGRRCRGHLAAPDLWRRLRYHRCHLQRPQMAVSLLVVLLVAKLAMTAVSIGGGFPGGVFAPSLFLGATLGDAYGAVAQGLFPRLLIAPQAYAMVGMAAVLAAAVHAAAYGDHPVVRNDTGLSHHPAADVRGRRRPDPGAMAAARFGLYAWPCPARACACSAGRDIEVLEGITVGEVMETGMTALAGDRFARAATDSLRARAIMGCRSSTLRGLARWHPDRAGPGASPNRETGDLDDRGPGLHARSSGDLSGRKHWRGVAADEYARCRTAAGRGARDRSTCSEFCAGPIWCGPTISPSHAAPRCATAPTKRAWMSRPAL